MSKQFRSYIRYLITGILLALTIAGETQTLSRHNWYFGNTARGIRFNRVTNAPALVNNKAIPFGSAGSSVATDHNTANVLFYTDGNNVFDATHTRMPNGNGLNANATANQPTAVCAVPGQSNKYFIFTNSATFTTGGSISATVVNMALFGNAAFPSPAFGDVESKNTPVPGLPARAEAMITIPHANGDDFWLITQEVNSTNFYSTLINAGSYTGTFSSIASGAAPFPTTAAHMAYHGTLRKIAVSPQDPSTDAIILNFNDATGVISFDRIILNSGVTTTTNQSIYDIEWSASGQYLYLSRHGEPGISANVFQYDYANPSTTLTPVLPGAVFRSYGLQLAPDTLVYHLYQSASGGPFLLGRIEKPDTIASEVNYNGSPFGALDFNGTQFPSFLPRDTIQLDVTFTSVGTCQNSATSFFPFVRPGADSLVWDFGDMSGGRGWGPVHTYTTTGAFNVTLTAFYQGLTESVTLPITINPFALQIQVTSDTTACRQEFPPPRGSSSPTQFEVTCTITGGTPSSVVWSNGDLGPTLTPDSAGYYYVIVTDAAGCSGYAGVNVREYGLQDQTFNKWYFGDRAGIDFNTQPPTPLAESVMNAPEGCAIVGDRNGETIFYTDGQQVFDKNHNMIATNIGGNPASTQSALIVPVPGDETLYYIFTTQAINGSDSLQLKYSLFDLKLNGGDGAVVKQDVFLFMRSTERITSNGNWLIAHEYGNSTFRCYPISPAGIGDPVYSSVGSDHSMAIQANGEGYMKLGPRNNLAVPLSNPGVSNHIELFTLIDTTGMIGNFRDITLSQSNGQIYGVEFSPAGNKLFVTVRLGPGSSEIHEYSIDSLEIPHFKQVIPVAADLGAIQIAPNGQLYVAVNDAANNTFLGTISANEDTTAVSSFTLNGFQLAAGTTSHLGLPNFIQINSSALGGPAITVQGVCFGDSTRFSATPRDQIDEYTWSVRQGNTVVASSTAATFAFLFSAPGNYTATLLLHNRCAPDTTLSRNFTIYSPPFNPTRGAVLCNGPAVLDANPPPNPANPNLTFLWSTDETTQTITVNEQGTAAVFVTDAATGCFVLGQFLIADNRPQFDLGPDLTICEDNATPALNAQNPGTTYQWTINGVNASTAQSQAVDTTVPGVFTYGVSVTDPVTTCNITDTKTYTITVSPAFTFTATNPISCGSATGSVTLQLNASAPTGGPLYSYFISGPGPTSQADIDQTAPNTYTINNLMAGTYSSIVTDQISGCTLSAAVGLTDATYTASAISMAPNCDPVTLQISTTAGVTYPVQYTATHATTGAVTTGTGPGSGFTTAPLPAGDYVIDIRDASAPPCTYTFNHTVAPNPPPAFTVTPNLCTLTITSSLASNWVSNPPGAIAGAFTGVNSISLVPNSGQVTFTATNATGCPGSQDVTLNVGPALVAPTLAQSDACAATVTLTASPPLSNVTYRWYRGSPGVLDNSLGGSQAQLGMTDNAITFSVEVFDPQTGCTSARSAPLVASVVGPVNGTLTSTPPCQDDQPFTLTATSTTPGVTYTWFRDGVQLAGVTTSTTSQTIEGTYRVDITRASCTVSGELEITRAPIPEGELPNRVVICNDMDNQDPATSSVDLDPGPFSAYEWMKNKLLINYTQRVLNADSEGLYEVELTNAFACIAIDQTEVLNECIPKIQAPNAFKPGSTVRNPGQTDLSNSDFWVITKFIEEDQFQVFIFNRWGEMVFSSDSRHFKWNGGYNNNSGQPLPPGTYSYLIRYVSAFRPDQGVQEKRGGVALLR